MSHRFLLIQSFKQTSIPVFHKPTIPFETFDSTKLYTKISFQDIYPICLKKHAADEVLPTMFLNKAIQVFPTSNKSRLSAEIK